MLQRLRHWIEQGRSEHVWEETWVVATSAKPDILNAGKGREIWRVIAVCGDCSETRARDLTPVEWACWRSELLQSLDDHEDRLWIEDLPSAGTESTRLNH
jgi:hypothetical protein